MSALPDEQLRRMVADEIRELNAATDEAADREWRAMRDRVAAWAESNVAETWGPFQTPFDEARAGALVDRCLDGATQIMAGLSGRASAMQSHAAERAAAEAKRLAREEAAPLRAAFDCAHDLMLAVFEAGLAVDDLPSREIQRTAADLLTHFPDIAAMFDEEG